MNRRKLNQFLCVLLSVVLLSTGIDFPVLAAAEETPVSASLAEESMPEAQADPETTQDLTGSEAVQTENVSSDYQFFVNPIYEDILDPAQQAAELEALQDRGQVQAKGTTRAAAVYQTMETAANYIRGEMVKRSTSFSFSVARPVYEASQDFTKEVFDAAMAYSRSCTGQEGDALLYGFLSSQVKTTITSGLITFDYTVLYHSDAAQEAALTAEVDKVLSELALDGKSNYEKVRLIHDYICNHVDYDDTYGNYSAYSALCEGSAVCQGYAVLFYRMCKDAGLSVRVLSGTGNQEPHAWNIVQVGSKYYNIDCTWDDQETRIIYDYFLKNDADFGNHTRDPLYTSTEFLSAYPVSSTSYIEGQEDDSYGLGIDNLEYDFLSIEDKEVFSAAQGKPKVLIFFKTSCGYSQASIRSIAQQGIPDVDILAIETTGQSKADVTSFKNTYGSDAIVFAYDTNGLVGNRAMWAYYNTAGNNSSTNASLPIICYIDANNKFQYLTTSGTTASAVTDNLKRYCNYGATGETYTITYMLDGGVNDSANPATYTKESPVITLKDPTKTGYTFAGWYSDQAFSHKVTQVGGGTIGNLTLYAKWEQSTAGLNINNPEVSFTTIDDQTVTSKADQKPKLLVFFRTTCSNSRRTIKAIADKGFSDVDIYALEVDGNAKENVSDFKDTYGSAQITFAYDTSAAYNQILFQYLQSAGMYTSGSISITLPVICYIDANNKLQYISQGYQSADDISARLEQYCQQKTPGETTAFTVEFDLQGHGTLSAEYTNGVSVNKDSLIQEPTAPKADGYTFTGWYKEKECKNKWDFAKDTVQADITLYAGWQAVEDEASVCTVTFNLQGRGTLPTEYKDGLSVKKGSLIQEPTAPKADGYIFTGWYKEKECKNKWDFSKDTVDEDITLYAEWDIDDTYDGILEDDMSAPEKKPSGVWVTGIKDATYTGQPITQQVRVYDGDRRLEEGLEYIVSYKNNKNATGTKKPAIIVSGKGNYKDFKKEYDFSIKPVDIGSTAGVLAEDVVTVYKQGKKQDKLVPTVTYNGKKLKNNKDFAVSCNGSGDYTTIGTYPITIKGTGNFTGTIKVNLEIIDGTPMSKVKVSKISAQKYNDGKQVKPIPNKDFKVKVGKKILKPETDYTVTYENNTEIGTATAVITGDKNSGYVGTKRVTFKITGTALSKTKVTGISSLTYSGKSQEQTNMKLTLKNTGGTLNEKEDYTVKYTKNKNAGKATITITGIGAYSGVIKKTFKIRAYKLEEGDKLINGLETDMKEKLVSGRAKPKPQLTFGDKRLIEGRDYTISYKNNNKVKSATDPKPPTIVIKGKGNFKGTITKTFTITE